MSQVTQNRAGKHGISDLRIICQQRKKIRKSDEVKIAILLTLIGEGGINIFNIFKEEDKKEVSYDKIIELFTEHCARKNNLVYGRYCFFKTQTTRRAIN